MTFAEYEMQNFGYEVISTFWQDFAIADRFGMNAVKDTYMRVMKEWAKDYKMLTELVIVLNVRCWQHYNNGKQALSTLYSDLYYKARNYAYDNLTGDELQYFYNTTD